MRCAETVEVLVATSSPIKRAYSRNRCILLIRRRTLARRYEQPDQEGIETPRKVFFTTSLSLRAARSRGHRNCHRCTRPDRPCGSLRAAQSRGHRNRCASSAACRVVTSLRAARSRGHRNRPGTRGTAATRRYEQPDQEGIETVTGCSFRAVGFPVATSSPIKRA